MPSFECKSERKVFNLISNKSTSNTIGGDPGSIEYRCGAIESESETIGLRLGTFRLESSTIVEDSNTLEGKVITIGAGLSIIGGKATTMV